MLFYLFLQRKLIEIGIILFEIFILKYIVSDANLNLHMVFFVHDFFQEFKLELKKNRELQWLFFMAFLAGGCFLYFFYEIFLKKVM